MSKQRYTPEFKDEAARQIVDRGYSVADVSERLGVSAHSLYKWVKAIKPDRTEEQAAALIEAKSEVLKLRAQLRRTEEERDILKKAARYFAREPEQSTGLSAIIGTSIASRRCVEFSRFVVAATTSGCTSHCPTEP
jgi:transposase